MIGIGGPRVEALRAVRRSSGALQPARRNPDSPDAAGESAPEHGCKAETQVTNWQKCTMLAVLAAMTIAAPANAAEGDDAAAFTGETIAVESTAATQETCKDPEVAPLLQDFKDDDLYFLAPGGDFEHGADGWQFDGGAAIGVGSNAFSPLGSGQSSLRLPAGSAATSPAFCVDERYPHFRISVGQLGTKKVKVRVSVVYPGLEKNVRREADVDADDKHAWKLSKRLAIKPRHGLKQNAWRLVALRFEVDKAEDAADARVDDILVDPRMR
jgi:hypothetical protein